MVNGPVVQSQLDGNGYWESLYKDFYGNDKFAGTLFMDKACSIDEPATDNWLIYGHNMNDGSMFGTLKYYKEEDGYYTLAVYGSDGAIKSKGYTLHSDDIPKIDVTYSADVNNNFTESDEYVEFIPTSVEVITQNPYTWIAPEGVTKLKYAVYFTSAGKERLYTSAITDVISGASYLFCYDTSAKTLVVPGLPKYTNISSANLFNRYEIRTGTSINNS